MKTRSIASILVTLTSLVATAAPATNSDSRFDKLKTLVGDWRTADGKTEVSYKLTSGQSTLMETLNAHGGMVSMYHVDGKNLMMTHYCALQNQPRMRAEPAKADDKTLTFDFLDATNMEGPKDMHMHKLVITFVDANHFKQEWTMYQDGKAGMTVVFEFERVK